MERSALALDEVLHQVFLLTLLVDVFPGNTQLDQTAKNVSRKNDADGRARARPDVKTAATREPGNGPQTLYRAPLHPERRKPNAVPV